MKLKATKKKKKKKKRTVFWKKAILDFCETSVQIVAMFEEIYFLMKMINVDRLSTLMF